MDKQHDTLKENSQETIDQAARAVGTTREKAKQMLTPQEQYKLSRKQAQSSHSDKQTGFYNEASDDMPVRQDGYQETEGSGYGESNNQIGQPAQDNPAQQGYDPRRSGPHTSKRRPGTKVPSPGRETGTAWAENEQMGYTMDTSDHSNPAN
ncbi:hypothetical protein [Ktedonospora formicarum]|uniref:Uncharacterized protein n=1 Tax=Ktedonospora formicarum TaxID=2778364 RepID=A0A8J3I3F8_9CHLR|nr:hypothetical protein [Ktedonospora formicarum]GHO45502.1 hypothetical protein KSX_36650 [Ktedonospora formicarum]